ncbi:MAG: hypothetical protein NC489_40050 [Ruminococcus flavefaciens]|nr:hypothetical protein [Ruminococcus flavefaciens]
MNPDEPVGHIDDSNIIKPGGRKFEALRKDFTSANDVTFSAMERGASILAKSTFVMDRGDDDNKMFLKLDSLGQDYVIRLIAKRKLLFRGKWVPATQLRDQRKGKIKIPLYYKGKNHDAGGQ